MPLHIHIGSIPEEPPKVYQGEVEIKELPQLWELIAHKEAQFNFRVEVYRKEESLLLKGGLEGAVELVCDRCLTLTRFGIKETFSIVMLPDKLQQDLDSELILSAEDLDTDYYSGDSLDLYQLLEEQALLGLPIKMLCSDECLGRCIGCGVNLNQRPCTCPPKDLSDHPFAVLLK